MMSEDPGDRSDPTRVAPAESPSDGDVAYLVVLTGLQTGSIFRAVGELGIGRDVDMQIRLVDLNVSRRHARVVAEGGRIFIEDLGSRNGTLVNKQTFSGRSELRDGDTISVGAATILKFTHHDGIEEEFERRIRDHAKRDSLTGLYRREYFEEQLQTEFSYARRHGEPLALFLIDVDELGDLNARWTRLSGDVVLALIARRLEPDVGADDVLAYYRGGTFAMLCRGLTEEQARSLAEAFRRHIASHPYAAVVRDLLIVTASVGIALLPSEDIGDRAGFVSAAERALREAKAAGGNRVRLATTR
jgi:two-component system cell cycle response regulator